MKQRYYLFTATGFKEVSVATDDEAIAAATADPECLSVLRAQDSTIIWKKQDA